MIKVFLSHVEEDANLVREFASFMELGNQIKCWTYKRDTSMFVTNIPVNIANEIANSDFMILFWSGNAKNKQTWIKREFALGIDKETRLQNEGHKLPFVIIFNIDETEPDDWLKGRLYVTPSEQDKLKQAFLQQPQEPWWNKSLMVIASSKLLTIHPNQTLAEAFFIMHNANVRHLIVTSDMKKVDGILSERDILEKIPPPLQYVPDNFPRDQWMKLNYDVSQMQIREIMTPAPQLIYLNHSDTIKNIAEMIIKPHGNHRISSVLIIDDNDSPIAIISYVDILCNKIIKHPRVSVSAYCTPVEKLILAKHSDTLAQIRLFMEQSGIRHMPILDDDGFLIGMIDINKVKWLSHPSINLANHHVMEYMDPIRSISTTDLNASILDVIHKIFCPAKNITAVPVVELVVDNDIQKYRILGIFSYVDALKAIYGHPPNK